MFEKSAQQGELAQQATQAIASAFQQYEERFKEITCRSKGKFEQRDWHGAQQDAVERLELYKTIINQIVPQVRHILAAQARDTSLWEAMKASYSELIGGSDSLELAETFFNSVTRRIFSTVGVNPEIEFVDIDFERNPTRPQPVIYHTIHKNVLSGTGSSHRLAQAILHILGLFPFEPGYAEPSLDAERAARVMKGCLQENWGELDWNRIEMLKPVFYRGTGAYLIGRVCRDEPGSLPTTGSYLPLVLCLLNPPGGVRVDAVLMDEDEVSIVFSFTRSYFHVDVQRPRQVIAFLKSIMPLKRIAELYISIGYNKHGKTELYRDLIRHLAYSKDKFKIARGERGMVMVVFTLDSYDMVFKVIKDYVEPPKTTSRAEVMERYDLVFRHDRAGRLVDAQEFEHLSFERARFSEDLVAELVRYAPSQVQVDEQCVSIRHLYTERRLTPLNLYVQEAPPEAAREAVVDYGKAIKDLAATNVFPGDVLLKNFGVTRHGRVVFYDYDELCLLTECKFRRMPQPRSMDDEFAAEPFFYVGPLDIFPAEFRTFLGLQEPLRSIFEEHHADLFDTPFWREMQTRHRQGEVVEIFPYPENKHLLDGFQKGP